MKKTILLLVLGLAAGLARPAAAEVRLGLGADWVVEEAAGIFELTLAVDTPVARKLTVGGRFGVALLAPGVGLGVPIDLNLRVKFGRSRVYLEGLIGPWIFFDGGDTLRFHGAIGFGLRKKAFEIGLEVGVLNRSPLLGLRLAWVI
ncbi:MAG: hypothetical protein P1V51_19130 [Deltaproteobacteria bacterium]|nr:hypothetical protein [Deltaproteobacteria bacterium]